MGGRKDRSEDIEMGHQGMWNSTSSEASSNANDPKRKGTKTEADTTPDDLEPNYQPVNWKRVFLAPKYIPVWIILIIVGVLTAIITLKHDEVVAALRPFAEKVRNVPAGWLIFVAVLFIISFPPLFGHEVVALLAGVVYGLWIGFAVVSAGTFVGEIGTWFAFKKFLRRKAEKMERTNLTYGAMARLCRDGGFWIVFVIRFSIIPSHLSTAVFSTCDVKFWHFAVSTFLTLPKQLILVYLGVLLVQEQDGATVKNALFAVAGVVTVLAGVWIWFKMAKYKKQLLAEQAERNANKEAQRLGLTRNDSGYGAGAPGTNPHDEPMPPTAGMMRNNSVIYHSQPSTQSFSIPQTPQQQQPQGYAPYRPEPNRTYGTANAGGPHGPYGHYDEDSYYHNADNTGDVGMARSDYGPPSYSSPPSYPLRQVDSVENGRPAQGKDFI
ncbi:cytoplasm protein [Diaporthe amygdali]|uniref:cytoplasm protein n=1 Tax=Phomopsis amygdali TaxID=1214568 RepID=UPI0022FDBF94|nr:cytoplasm protein [Diaporthe amygdali]KAJ0116960.1 cytoplasm protein [Diaporthe amygdali]